MQDNDLVIEKMLTINESGEAQPPTIRQLQNKDVALLWSRDTSASKQRYKKEVGVIYYLGDPKGPARERGLSDAESLKEAIENYDLPKDYIPDALVYKLANKYYINNITEAGTALEALQRSIHLSAVAATRINDLLSKKLSGAIAEEDINSILTLIDNVAKRISTIPELTISLKKAYENLRDEKDEQVGRGKQTILSSMDANEG